jgi:hypothetical protein
MINVNRPMHNDGTKHASTQAGRDENQVERNYGVYTLYGKEGFD